MNPQTDIVKNVLDILKERPFIWVVLFLSCSLLLFSPLLEFLGNNSVSINIIAVIKLIIGIFWVISGVAILSKIIMYYCRKIASFIKRELVCNENFKRISNLSYDEKLLLYIAVVLKMPIVPVPENNRIALMLAEKAILSMPNSFFSKSPLGAECFRIPDSIWKILSSKRRQEIIFKDFLSKDEEDLKKELKMLLPDLLV
jgi:hypothetical protein